MSVLYDPRNNGRQRTSKAWRGVDVEKLKLDPSRGLYYRTNFNEWTDIAANGYNGQATYLETTNGTANAITNDGRRMVEVDSAGTGDNTGVSLFWNNVIVKPAAGGVIVMEGRVRQLDIATGAQMVFGLTDSADVTIQQTNDALTATDYALFNTIGSGTAGLVRFATRKASGTASTKLTGVHTFLDGDTVTDDTEWAKLCLRINGVSGIELYVDGEEIVHSLDAAAISILTLHPVIELLANGTTDPIAHLDYFEIAQI